MLTETNKDRVQHAGVCGAALALHATLNSAMTTVATAQSLGIELKVHSTLDRKELLTSGLDGCTTTSRGRAPVQVLSAEERRLGRCGRGLYLRAPTESVIFSLKTP